MIEHKVFNSNTFAVLKVSKVFRTLIDSVQGVHVFHKLSVTKECSTWEYFFSVILVASTWSEVNIVL